MLIKGFIIFYLIHVQKVDIISESVKKILTVVGSFSEHINRRKNEIRIQHNN